TGDFVRADYTVTFTAPKPSQVLSPIYEQVGKLIVCPIGTPDELCGKNPDFKLNVITEADLRDSFQKRPLDSNKGMYGHVLVVGGSFGKSGAPSMTGVGA